MKQKKNLSKKVKDELIKIINDKNNTSEVLEQRLLTKLRESYKLENRKVLETALVKTVKLSNKRNLKGIKRFKSKPPENNIEIYKYDGEPVSSILIKNDVFNKCSDIIKKRYNGYRQILEFYFVLDKKMDDIPYSSVNNSDSFDNEIPSQRQLLTIGTPYSTSDIFRCSEAYRYEDIDAFHNLYKKYGNVKVKKLWVRLIYLKNEIIENFDKTANGVMFRRYIGYVDNEWQELALHSVKNCIFNSFYTGLDMLSDNPFHIIYISNLGKISDYIKKCNVRRRADIIELSINKDDVYNYDKIYNILSKRYNVRINLYALKNEVINIYRTYGKGDRIISLLLRESNGINHINPLLDKYALSADILKLISRNNKRLYNRNKFLSHKKDFKKNNIIIHSFYDFETLTDKCIPVMLGVLPYWNNMVELNDDGQEIIKNKIYNHKCINKNCEYKTLILTECPVENFIKLLTNTKNNTGNAVEIIFHAHYGGRFDVRLLINEIIKLVENDFNYIQTDGIYMNGSFVIFGFKNIQEKITFRFHDTKNYFSKSLEDVTKDFKILHVKRSKPNFNRTLEEVDFFINEIMENDYLSYDVIGLTEVFNLFNNTIINEFKIPNGLNNLYTSASISKGFFLNQYYEKNTNFYQIKTPDEYKTFKNYFHGAIVEAFYPGVYNSKIYINDVKSMYPSCYTNTKLSIGEPTVLEYNIKPVLGTGEELKKIVEGVFNDNIKRISLLLPYGNEINRNDFNIFLELEILSDGNLRVKNFIPFKIEGRGLFFPNFNHVTRVYITNPEYERLIRGNHNYKIINILKIGVAYNGGAPILRNFGLDMYQKRLNYKNENNASAEETCKLILNSIYGIPAKKLYVQFLKICSINEYNENLLLKDLNNMIKISKLGYMKNSKYIWVMGEEYKDNFEMVNILFASEITSAARIKLLDMIDELENNGIKTLYCDTDSIITDTDIRMVPNIYNKFFDVDNIGGLFQLGKLDTKTFNSAVIINKKHYCLKDDKKTIIKWKGYRFSDEEQRKNMYDTLSELINTGMIKSKRQHHQKVLSVGIDEIRFKDVYKDISLGWDRRKVNRLAPLKYQILPEGV